MANEYDYPKTPMCDRLSAAKHDRSTLLAFFDFLGKRYAETEVVDIHPQRAIMAFLEIDEQRLEAERRELLEYQRLVSESA